ncbi:hypothetical protein FRB97_000576 [Tulasnella sp. 331]|nr:hypothetical protein FRB97_000576 [Tulasnella sp. 331]
MDISYTLQTIYHPISIECLLMNSESFFECYPRLFKPALRPTNIDHVPQAGRRMQPMSLLMKQSGSLFVSDVVRTESRQFSAAIPSANLYHGFDYIRARSSVALTPAEIDCYVDSGMRSALNGLQQYAFKIGLNAGSLSITGKVCVTDIGAVFGDKVGVRIV